MSAQRRPQREMWICGAARAERLSLGKGWQVRLSLKPWRSKVPVKWSMPIVARRVAEPHEVLRARLLTPGWPPEGDPGFDEAFVLIDSAGQEYVMPQGVKLTLQRLRTPQRESEAGEWRFR